MDDCRFQAVHTRTATTARVGLTESQREKSRIVGLDRFLTVAEQMVTDFESQDMTPVLNSNSYWASYNNVYFPRFRDISGEEKLAQLRGPELYSWQNSSRARIFARDHVKVVDLPSMIRSSRPRRHFIVFSLEVRLVSENWHYSDIQSMRLFISCVRGE